MWINFLFFSVLSSIITTTAFQILVSNNSPIKPITDTTIITLEVRMTATHTQQLYPLQYNMIVLGYN